MTVLLLLFALSLLMCVYVYGGYPLLLLVLSGLRSRPVERRPILPMVSVIVPVFNEEEVIEAKILNTFALDYPPDKLELLIISDGSTDRSEEIVSGHVDSRLRLLRLPRQGKALALNAAAKQAVGEILVFSDANSELEPPSVRRLMESFADPGVGGVCGNKKYRSAEDADSTGEGENLYWRYDKWQKGLESRLGSIFAADGALYAVRKRLYVPIEDPAQADDIAISTRVVLQGYRLLYDARAVALETAPIEGREEFRRKIRVTNHSVRALFNLGSALWSSGFYSVELLSHKLFRHFVPFFLIVLLGCTTGLAALGQPIFGVFLLLQILFYTLGALGLLLRRSPAGRLRVFSVPYYFCLVNTAALLGVLSIWRGQRPQTWTPRSGF